MIVGKASKFIDLLNDFKNEDLKENEVENSKVDFNDINENDKAINLLKSYRKTVTETEKEVFSNNEISELIESNDDKTRALGLLKKVVL